MRIPIDFEIIQSRPIRIKILWKLGNLETLETLMFTNLILNSELSNQNKSLPLTLIYLETWKLETIIIKIDGTGKHHLV